MIKNRLKEFRVAKGLTIKELARLVGRSQSTIGYIDTMCSGGSLETRELLSRALDVPVDEIFPHPVAHRWAYKGVDDDD